jgi:NADPH:quinone reductase-like Zn-dependent oxidoreductase
MRTFVNVLTVSAVVHVKKVAYFGFPVLPLGQFIGVVFLRRRTSTVFRVFRDFPRGAHDSNKSSSFSTENRDIDPSHKKQIDCIMKAMQLMYHTAQAKAIDVEKPGALGPQEVLVKVQYSAIDTGVEALVQKTITGMFIHARTDPLILGWHFSGVIAEIGDQVSSLKLQDHVWGFLQYQPSQKQGSFAEYIKVSADECAVRPRGVGADIAAAASTESLTALQAMKNLCGLQKDGSVLILGAGGGVGSAAVQIAKILGAHVTAVVGTKDVERVKALGADVVLDRSKDDPLGGDAMYDVIFDTPSKYWAPTCMKKLSGKGTYVTTLPSLGLYVGMFLSFFNAKGSKFVECKSTTEDLKLVGSWLDEGKLKIDIDSTYPIRNLEAAVTRQSDPSKIGRIVIQVDGGWE